MLLSDAIRKRIKNLLKENNMNIWKLYKATGVSASTLSYFMSGKRELINLKTLLHICVFSYFIPIVLNMLLY